MREWGEGERERERGREREREREREGEGEREREGEGEREIPKTFLTPLPQYITDLTRSDQQTKSKHRRRYISISRIGF